MKAISKVKEFTFTGNTQKEAYLKGCKELAKYMASKTHQNLVTQIVRKDNEVTFTIYCSVELLEPQQRFCKICKEMHTNFYINTKYNCDACNVKAFLNRLHSQLNVAQNYYKKEVK